MRQWRLCPDEWVVRKAHDHLLVGHSKEVTAMECTDGTRLFSASRDATVKAWSIDSGECFATLVGHLGGVRALCVYGNGVLSGATDAIVKYWSESSWTVARSFKTADGSKDTAVTSIDVCDH